MKTLLERNLTESFTSQWISLREFQRVVFHLRTQPGSNAAGSFAVKGSNATSVSVGLSADPRYAADPSDIATVTSLFSVHGDLAQPDRLDATVAAHTSGLPNFVRFDYTRTGGTRGEFELALDGEPRAASADRLTTPGPTTLVMSTSLQTAATVNIPGPGKWLVEVHGVLQVASVTGTRTLDVRVTSAVANVADTFYAISTAVAEATLGASASLTHSTTAARPLNVESVINATAAGTVVIAASITVEPSDLDVIFTRVTRAA